MLTDSKTGYGAISILFHWLGAAAVIAVWYLGDRIDDVPKAEKAMAQNLHFGVGVLALVILVPRLLWRFTHSATPMAATHAPLLDLIAKVVKWGLLTAMTLLVVTGPFSVFTGRHNAIDVFGFVIPSPVATNATVHEVLQVIHVVSAKAIFVLVALHVLGALKHLIIDRDGVFRRMLVPAR